MFQLEFFKSIFNKLKSCLCIWFCMLLLYFGTGAYLYSPDEGSCYVFFYPKQLLRVSCILWCYFQSDIQSYIKMRVCGAFLSYHTSLRSFQEQLIFIFRIWLCGNNYTLFILYRCFYVFFAIYGCILVSEMAKISENYYQSFKVIIRQIFLFINKLP